eukprot:8223766-Karenia_brevis.AAC.1
MWGASEAAAESVGSLLKRYATAQSFSKLSPQRVIEKAIMRYAGLAGDGSDDFFLLRCWAEYFGGVSSEDFNFNFESKKKLQAKYPWGAGSKTLHWHLKRTARQR